MPVISTSRQLGNISRITFNSTVTAPWY